MTPFRYTGPFSGATLPDGAEVLLHPGQEVQLPDPTESAWVAGLIARGHLARVEREVPRPDASAKSPVKPKSLKGGE